MSAIKASTEMNAAFFVFWDDTTQWTVPLCHVFVATGEVTDQLTNSKGHSHVRSKHWLTEGYLNILWNMNVNYKLHKSSQLVFILSHMNPVYCTSLYSSKIHFWFTLLPKSTHSYWSLHREFPTSNLHPFPFSPCDTCTELILFNSI
jgi:hypothetical protein